MIPLFRGDTVRYGEEEGKVIRIEFFPTVPKTIMSVHIRMFGSGEIVRVPHTEANAIQKVSWGAKDRGYVPKND